MNKSTDPQQVIVCGFCGHEAPRMAFGYFSRPSTGYNEIIRCPNCRMWFSPVEPLPPWGIDKRRS